MVFLLYVDSERTPLSDFNTVVRGKPMKENTTNLKPSRVERPRLNREDLIELNKERLGPYLIRLAFILPLAGLLHWVLFNLIQGPVYPGVLTFDGVPGSVRPYILALLATLDLVFLGFIMSGLMVLAHEISHGHLIQYTPLNLVLGTIMAIPLAVPYPLYGLAHKLHHTYNTTKRDPSYYDTESGIIRLIGKVLHYFQLTFFLSFFSVLQQLFVSNLKGIRPTPFRVILAVLLYSSIAGLFFILGPSLFFWHMFLPWLSFQFWNTTRAIGEHEYLYDGEDGHRRQIETTRSLKMGFLTRYFWWYAGYHIEHHLYPSIPFHNLPRVSELLNLDQQSRPTYLEYMKYRWKRGAEFPMFF